MTPLILTAAFAFVAWLFVYVCATTQPAPEPTARHRASVVAVYRPPTIGQPAKALPRRPDGRQALKAEMRHVYVPAKVPSLRIRKERPDWAWHTDEHKHVWTSFFDGQPADQAVQMVEAGRG